MSTRQSVTWLKLLGTGVLTTIVHPIAACGDGSAPGRDHTDTDATGSPATGDAGQPGGDMTSSSSGGSTGASGSTGGGGSTSSGGSTSQGMSNSNGTSGFPGGAAGAAGAVLGDAGAGVCVQATANQTCDDDDICTLDECDANDACVHIPRTCDDLDACTMDFCGDSGCSHRPIVCDDGNGCTFDQCDASRGCQHPANTDVCTPSGCTSHTTDYSSTPNLSIAPEQTVTDTIEVSDLTGSVWTVLVSVDIPHEFSRGVDVWLTSPDGVTTALTEHNGNAAANVFAGTTFSDRASAPVTTYPFMSNVAADFVIPEGALAAMRGGTPNGSWTLTVTNDVFTYLGSLVSWDLRLVTLEQAPASITRSFDSAPGSTVSDVSPVAAPLEVSGLVDPICGVRLRTELPHGYPQDLIISLQSPRGTRISISERRGKNFDDVFNGTTWIDAAESVATHLFNDHGLVTPLTPEGAFDQVLGEDANGTWTLHVDDRIPGDDGTLESWGLDISTCRCDL